MRRAVRLGCAVLALAFAAPVPAKETPLGFPHPIVRDADRLHFPRGYDPSRKYPLVVLLHAFKVSGGFQKAYFGLGRRMHRDGFLLYVPGTVRDSRGHRFWNAQSYCCNHDALPVDDVEYLRRSITEIVAKHAVDADRVYLLGHSNGGMMAHRMACEHADLFAAAASLAGSGATDPAECRPNSEVAFLEVHARNDGTVPYAGMDAERLARRLKRKPLYPYAADAEKVRYPSAPETMQAWAERNGCDLERIRHDGEVHYATNTFGRETTRLAWAEGCRNDASVHLWTLKRGGHVPRFNAAFKNDVVDFLLSHRKRRSPQ